MLFKPSRNNPLAEYFGPAQPEEPSSVFACPACGAVLRDSRSESCPYCRAAFVESFANLTTRVWHTDDGGETWTILTRTCPTCGALVTDCAANRCTRCGHEPLPPLAVPADPRPTASIRIGFPPVATGQGTVVRRTSNLVRYLECRHWPVPPAVPKAIAPLLRPLPDACQHCGATAFDVVHDQDHAWQISCSVCWGDPGTRPDAD